MPLLLSLLKYRTQVLNDASAGRGRAAVKSFLIPLFYPLKGAWFDRLTMSGDCYPRKNYLRMLIERGNERESIFNVPVAGKSEARA